MVAAVVNQTANVNTISVPIILCCYFSSSADIWNFVRLFFSVSFYFIIIFFFFLLRADTFAKLSFLCYVLQVLYRYRRQECICGLARLFY